MPGVSAKSTPHQRNPRDEISRFLAGFLLVPLDQSVIACYCDLRMAMAKKGKPVDYPDLSIGAHALT